MIDASPPRDPGAYPFFLPTSPAAARLPASPALPMSSAAVSLFGSSVFAAAIIALRRIRAVRLVRALVWLTIRLLVGALAVGVMLGIANLTIATLVTLYAHVTPYTGAG